MDWMLGAKVDYHRLTLQPLLTTTFTGVREGRFTRVGAGEKGLVPEQELVGSAIG